MTTRSTTLAAPRPGSAARAAGSSVLHLLRDAARLDRTQSDPVVALRNAIGVAVPLALGTLTGNAALGLAGTIGALQTAFADRPGPYRLRIARMLGTAAVAGTTSGLAVLFSRSPAASVALLLVLALGAGLLLSAGPSATQVGTAAVAAALVLGHTPRPASAALGVGVLVLAGGGVQTLLAVAAWPLGRHRPERISLAALYRELAAAARLPRGSVAGPPASDALATTRSTLYGLGHDHGPSVEAYRVLLDEAERIRRELIVITAAAERLAAERNPILAGFARESLTAAGSVLDEIAEALDAARDVRAGVLDQARATLRFAITRLEESADAPGQLTRRATAARLRALSGQLRAAVDSTRAGASEGGRGDGPEPSGASPLRDPVAILRANLTPSSAVLRHAVRLAVLVAGADLVTRAVGFDRGYWVSLTLLVVLRPDFGATLQRASMRTVGTVVGLLAASELVHWVPGGAWWNVALVAVFAFGMRFAGPGNVALSAVSLSALVVVLLAISGIPPHATLVERSLATVIGGSLAVLAALALPSWERSYVRTRLATLLGAYRDYLVIVADLGSSRSVLQRARAACRLARSNAQASVDRARAEPVPAAAEVELGETVLVHSHRVIHAVLMIDALRPAIRAGGGLAQLTRFCAVAGDALALLQESVRTGVAPRAMPKLRPVHDDLVTALDAYPDRVGDAASATTLIDATDRITNSLDTLAGQLRRGREPQPAAVPGV